MRKGEERLLLTHRECMVYLDRAKVRVSGNRVVYDVADGGVRKTYNVPYANLATVMLGQGCSITSDACRLLGEENVFVAMTGGAGAPLFYGTLSNYRPTDHFRRMATAWLDEDEGLKMAKALATTRATRAEKGLSAFDGVDAATDRFRAGILSSRNKEELLGAEGTFTKQIYHLIARTKLSGFVRDHKPGGASAQDRVNRYINQGNGLVYGIVGSALWALGIPPGMAVLHGRTNPGGLVFDVADAFKDSIVLLPAFDIGIRGGTDSGTEFKSEIMESLDREKILQKTFDMMGEILPDQRV